MRRLALCTALVTLALAATAVAGASHPVATLSVDPNTAGKPSTATLDVSPPTAGQNPRAIVLRVVRGVKFDPRSRAVKCTKAQASANNCPAGSRIGGGTTKATVTSDTNAFPPQKIKLTVDLFLMPPLKQGDLAGSVAHFKVTATGQEGHAFGRVTKIPQGKFGIQTRFAKLDTALTPPAGTRAHIDHLHLTFGAKRTVQKNGKPVTHHLITNPKTCNGTWPYQVICEYAAGGNVVVDRSGPCKP